MAPLQAAQLVLTAYRPVDKSREKRILRGEGYNLLYAATEIRMGYPGFCDGEGKRVQVK